MPELGIMVISLDSSTANMFGPTRLVSGAAVIARLTTQEASIDLRPGDVIHAINGQSVYTVDNLKEALGTHG